MPLLIHFVLSCLLLINVSSVLGRRLAPRIVGGSAVTDETLFEYYGFMEARRTSGNRTLVRRCGAALVADSIVLVSSK
jgi:hypothetical protein